MEQWTVCGKGWFSGSIGKLNWYSPDGAQCDRTEHGLHVGALREQSRARVRFSPEQSFQSSVSWPRAGPALPSVEPPHTPPLTAVA